MVDVKATGQWTVIAVLGALLVLEVLWSEPKQEFLPVPSVLESREYVEWVQQH